MPNHELLEQRSSAEDQKIALLIWDMQQQLAGRRWPGRNAYIRERMNELATIWQERMRGNGRD